MTKAEIRAYVRRSLDDATSAFYSDDDLDDAIDEAWEDLADGAEWYERIATLTALEQRTYFDLSEILPDTVLTPKQMYNSTANTWLTSENIRDLDSNRRQWELADGTPHHSFMYGNWWLGIYPRSTSAIPVRVLYTAIPEPLEDDEEIDFDAEFQDAVVDGALYVLYVQQRETTKAMRYWKRYAETEAEFAGWVNQRQSTDRISRLKG